MEGTPKYVRRATYQRLQDDEVFTVYSVPPGGELKAHTQRLKKGELVFVDMNGKPILRARCRGLGAHTVAFLPVAGARLIQRAQPSLAVQQTGSDPAGMPHVRKTQSLSITLPAEWRGW